MTHMNEDFFERLVNAACTAVGVGLVVTLDPYYVAIGTLMVVMSFPDCLGHFNSERYEFVVDDEETV